MVTATLSHHDWSALVRSHGRLTGALDSLAMQLPPEQAERVKAMALSEDTMLLDVIEHGVKIDVIQET